MFDFQSLRLNQKIYLESIFKTDLSKQFCRSDPYYCKDVIDSVEVVPSCPTSKVEWDSAASKKNCNIRGAKQACTIADNFIYHCVINIRKNETLEVCAPGQFIYGNAYMYM